MTTEIYRPTDWNLLRPGPGGALDDDAAFLTTVVGLRDVIAWGRGNAVWPMTFGLACCAIEMMAFASTRYDVDRLGCGAFRATPRQADLMITAGTVTYKMAHRVRRLWEQMPEPKWVMAMGACTVGGGPYSKWGYHVVQGVDLVIPVDVHVPGCPPRPEALIDGLRTLQELIFKRGSIEQQAAIAEAVRAGQKDVMEGRIPGFRPAPGAAPGAAGTRPAAKAAPRLSAPSAPGRAPNLKAPSLKAPPLPGGMKLPGKPAGGGGAPPLPAGMSLPPGPAAPASPSAPAAPEAAPPAPSPSGGYPPTAKVATGPMPPDVLAANRDSPSGPPQPYVPIHRR